MRPFSSAIITLFILSSCADKSNNDIVVFRATEEGLQQSIRTISYSNEIIYRSLESRLQDPESMIYAAIWQPKATMVKKISDDMIKYLEGLKEELKNEAGPDKSGEKGSFKEADISAVNHFFNDHGKGKELFDQLIKYKKDVLAVDSEINKKITSDHIAVFSRDFYHTEKDAAAFTKLYVNNVPVIAALMMISKFENNVKINENMIVSFCNSNTYHVDGPHDTVLPVVMQSRTSVKAGEEIEITAGIAMFTQRADPVITVGGKHVTVEFGGVAYHKLKTALSPGKYSVPVKIEFFKPDGNKEYFTKNITYTVEE